MITKIQDRLIAVREALDITQRDFCRGIYVSQSYYAQIESGKRPVNDRIIALVCSQYGVSKEYLAAGKGAMFRENLPDWKAGCKPRQYYKFPLQRRYLAACRRVSSFATPTTAGDNERA